MDEDILFFGLHKEVSLGSNVAEEPEHVQGSREFQVVQHGVQDYIGTGSTDASTETDKIN